MSGTYVRMCAHSTMVHRKLIGYSWLRCRFDQRLSLSCRPLPALGLRRRLRLGRDHEPQLQTEP